MCVARFLRGGVVGSSREGLIFRLVHGPREASLHEETGLTFVFEEGDREGVLEALAEIRAEPPPTSYAGVGCVMALPGFLLLLLVPPVGRMLNLAQGFAVVGLVLGGVLLVVGLILWFTAGSLTRRHSIAAAEAALRTLEVDGQEREVQVRAATLLLCNAHATHGPATVQSFDIEAARTRLGSRLPLVEAVEELLLEEAAVYPVFTSEALRG